MKRKKNKTIRKVDFSTVNRRGHEISVHVWDGKLYARADELFKAAVIDLSIERRRYLTAKLTQLSESMGGAFRATIADGTERWFVSMPLVAASLDKSRRTYIGENPVADTYLPSLYERIRSMLLVLDLFRDIPRMDMVKTEGTLAVTEDRTGWSGPDINIDSAIMEARDLCRTDEERWYPDAHGDRFYGATANDEDDGEEPWPSPGPDDGRYGDYCAFVIRAGILNGLSLEEIPAPGDEGYDEYCRALKAEFNYGDFIDFINWRNADRIYAAMCASGEPESAGSENDAYKLGRERSKELKDAISIPGPAPDGVDSGTRMRDRLEWLGMAMGVYDLYSVPSAMESTLFTVREAIMDGERLISWNSWRGAFADNEDEGRKALGSLSEDEYEEMLQMARNSAGAWDFTCGTPESAMAVGKILANALTRP